MLYVKFKRPAHKRSLKFYLNMPDGTSENMQLL